MDGMIGFTYFVHSCFHFIPSIMSSVNSIVILSLLITLLDFISCIETCLGQKARVNLLPMQPGDVRHTKADVQALHDAVGYTPTTPVEIGVPRFVEWYRAYYGV